MINEFQGEYRLLSNFWYKDVYLPDDTFIYSTNEHAYQAAKTLDMDVRKAIKNAETPAKAKMLGRAIDLRPNWNIERCKVMLYITRIKYDYSDMAALLLNTGTQQLIEGNTWHDNFWGICYCQSCTQERITNTRLGRNWLGKILMMVRMELQIKRGIE